jgi:hypothetical protein
MGRSFQFSLHTHQTLTLLLLLARFTSVARRIKRQNLKHLFLDQQAERDVFVVMGVVPKIIEGGDFFLHKEVDHYYYYLVSKQALDTSALMRW